MTMRTNCILLLVILLGAFPLNRVHADESGSIILYTPYTKISVTPGASIDYSIDLINNTDGVTNANLSVSGLPGSWKHEIKSGGWTLSQLSVLSKEKKTFNLKVDYLQGLAATGTSSADVELEVVVTGSYKMELSTPRGLLSTEIKSVDVKRIELVVRNTGSSLLKDIQLSANKPVDWEVSFEPSKIDMLKAGETANVVAIMKASKKALPGDYVATMTAKTPEVNTDAQFRIAVKTPMIWGWVGVLIIIVAIGAVCYLFRKYGRR